MDTAGIYLKLEQLISQEQLKQVDQLFAAAPFRDGRDTASAAARAVKQNLQMNDQSPQHAAMQQIILASLNNSPLFRAAIFPLHVNPFLMSSYKPGMSYGWHVDSPVMGNMMRTDIAMTIFLNGPDEYEGGELELQTTTGLQLYKLSKGDAICYPCTQLHRVREVTKGERRVAVTWIQSLVKNAEQRAILFGLQQVIDTLRQKDLQSAEANMLQQSHSNLLRMWAEN